MDHNWKLKNGQIIKCPTCGKGKYRKKSLIIRGVKFCSISCAKKGKIPLNLKIAQSHSPVQKGNKIATCLKGRKRPSFSKEWKEKIRLSNIEKGKKHSGKNHWNWHGGISGWQKLLRGSRKYEKWRLQVYKRDRYCCRKCKKHCDSKIIVAHHIKNFKNYPKLRFNLKNGITLCRKCHILLHRKLRLSTGSTMGFFL
jgi:hypothetical protein